MPMSNAVRVPLYRILCELRPMWSQAEVNDATVTLAKQDGDPATLVLQAVAQARKPSNDRAVSVTWPIQAEAVVRTLTARLPDQRECPTHFGVAVDSVSGEFACCLQERAGDPDPAPFQRPVCSSLTDEKRAELRSLAFPNRKKATNE